VAFNMMPSLTTFQTLGLPRADLLAKTWPGSDKERFMSAFTLHDLEKRVADRAQASAEVSYTRKLIDRGLAQCAKKLGEEAVEAVVAALAEDKSRMIAEAADVLYHLLVVLHVRGISLDEVEAELAARTRQSGLDEKAARKGG
jgi:phosphoribosyl-ATP pyrophosphohydrolase